MKSTLKHMADSAISKRQLFDLLAISLLGTIVLALGAFYDLLEILYEFSRQHEHWEIDELIVVTIFIAFALAYFSARRWQELRQTRNILQKHNAQLEKAMQEIRKLQGILPICANCKKIRDDAGYWQEVELYVKKHSEATFSHSICPTCLPKLYPDIYDQEGGQKAAASPP